MNAERTNVETAIDWYAETFQKMNTSSTVQQSISTIQTIVKKVQLIIQELFAKIQQILTSTSLEPLIEKINSTCTDLEKAFNIAGCAPIICIISSPLRVLAGKLQIIAGGTLATIGEIGLFLTVKPDANRDLIRKWHIIARLGTEHLIHGCLNVLRGTCEGLAGGFSMGFTNLFLLIPNISLNRNFSPYFAYGTLLSTKTLNNQLTFPAGTNIEIEIKEQTNNN